MSTILQSTHTPLHPNRTVSGTIRRRLLVNSLVDPDEASEWLPDFLRPHVTEFGTVVGCCLLDIGHLRPSALPAAAGVGVRAVAHRISVEWRGDDDQPVVGVYVPTRLTDSRLAIALGGRWFPGVHRRAHMRVRETADRLDWAVRDADGSDRFAMRVTVSKTDMQAPCTHLDAVGATCLGATVGLSPDRHGALEAAHMQTDGRMARLVEIEDIHSEFLASFASARPAPSFLMQDIAVTWAAGLAPRITPAGVER